MKIAYFINQYPKVSHSFIRREILALERHQGFEILRTALRGWDGELPDEGDREERRRTRYVLSQGLSGLLLPLIACLVRSPAQLLRALRLAVRMARDSDRSLAYHLVYLAEACCVVLWLKEFGAQHLHAHFGTNSAEVAMLAHALGGPPYSFTVHGPDEFMKSIGLSEKIHRAAFVVGVSEFGRSQLYMRSAYSDWPKIKVVRCGVEKAFYEGADRADTSVSDAPRFVCVGRFCEAKGQLLLLEAAARLAARRIHFELVLAGDGPLRAEIEQLIRIHGLGDRVRITGWISSATVRKEILAARAMVLPSFAEGLPVVIMEAMALRRPVLSTYVAGIPELVRPGETGWLFPAGSVEELVRAMEDCLSKTAPAIQRMGDAAHRMVVARHSIETEAASLGKLFHTFAALQSDLHAREHPTRPQGSRR